MGPQQTAHLANESRIPGTELYVMALLDRTALKMLDLYNDAMRETAEGAAMAEGRSEASILGEWARRDARDFVRALGYEPPGESP